MVTLASAPSQAAVSAVRIVQAPITEVYALLNERDAMQRWLADHADVRSAVGGHILLTWQGGHFATGAFTALDKNERVAFTWRAAGQSQDTTVDFRLREENGATRLEVSETGFAPDTNLDAVQRAWEKRLDALQAALELGDDIRITHRVIIGIYPTDFDEQIAAKLGVPVTEGTRVGNLVEGYSAADAGIQSDDVIVAVNGKTVNNQTPMFTLMQDNKPGDVVEVTLYRGSEKHTIPVTLKGYPLPPKADSFAQIADRLEKTYADINAELAGLFEAHSEADAARKPGEDEWSANEVLAHLIMSERWLHNSLGTFMDGPLANGWSCNHISRIKAVTAVYPTSADLLAELRRGFAETIALLRNIPDQAAERKSRLWTMNFTIDGMALHARQHVEQIRAALKA